jgi:tellurite resistance protein TerC
VEAVWPWILFNLFVLAMLAVDLGVFHRKAHEVRLREAAAWSAVWVALSLLFAIGLWQWRGPQAGLEFLTGYLIEKALSVDNIFVFVLLFSWFGVPSRYQHRVLFWGILGALVMRGGMIAAGAVLVERFHWILYVFGAFLVFTGIRMALSRDEAVHPEANPAIRLLRRLVPVTSGYRGQRMLVREEIGGRLRLAATPLLVVLVLVETTDVVFAVDSIPAIFAVTRDPFLVYSSNVFAILGLRALYFLLAGIIHRFHYLKLGLSAVLAFVGTKMLVAEAYAIPIALSLGVVAAILTTSVVASLVFPRRRAPDAMPGARATPPAEPPPWSAEPGRERT